MNLSNKTIVVNAPKRPDRKKLFQDMLDEHFPDLEVEYTTDWKLNKNGEDITDEWLSENNIQTYPDWNMPEGVNYNNEETYLPWWKRDMTQGEKGCAISHYAIWSTVGDYDYVTVLEDDTYFLKNMKLEEYNMIDTLNNMGIDWDLLYLGRTPQDPTIEESAFGIYNLVKPKFTYCTYGYTLSRSGIEKLKGYNLNEGKIIPSDEMLTATFFPHHREDIRKLIPPTLNAFSFEVGKEIVHQHEIELVGSDTGPPNKDIELPSGRKLKSRYKW